MLVTGSAGLVGSAVAEFFCQKGWKIYGMDNNMRRDFFGAGGDTRESQQRLLHLFPDQFIDINLDIRNRQKVEELLREIQPEAIVHTAAQPSHDLAAERVFDDFDINAVGTLNLLEATRSQSPDSIFIHLSTNKVYGDAPNDIRLKECKTRWDFDDPQYLNGIDEQFGIDQSQHSIFGASKVAADIMVQEYGRYFGLYTCCLRGGCLTGPNHKGVSQHGFLNYLIRSNIEQRLYTIYGYKGKQVRDNIHAWDVAAFIDCFIQNPRKGEVYNLGGGRKNSISILEAFEKIETLSDIKMNYKYSEKPRRGDHICYISDLTKINNHYPQWSLHKSIDDIFLETYKVLATKVNL